MLLLFIIASDFLISSAISVTNKRKLNFHIAMSIRGQLIRLYYISTDLTCIKCCTVLILSYIGLSVQPTHMRLYVTYRSVF
jgi:hypothetical protein